MLGNGESRRVFLYASEVFTEVFPEGATGQSPHCGEESRDGADQVAEMTAESVESLHVDGYGILEGCREWYMYNNMICGMTSNSGINQLISNVMITMICHKGGIKKDPHRLWVVVQDAELVKQNLLDWLIEREVSKSQ